MFKKRNFNSYQIGNISYPILFRINKTLGENPLPSFIEDELSLCGLDKNTDPHDKRLLRVLKSIKNALGSNRY